MNMIVQYFNIIAAIVLTHNELHLCEYFSKMFSYKNISFFHTYLTHKIILIEKIFWRNNLELGSSGISLESLSNHSIFTSESPAFFTWHEKRAFDVNAFTSLSPGGLMSTSKATEKFNKCMLISTYINSVVLILLSWHLSPIEMLNKTVKLAELLMSRLQLQSWEILILGFKNIVLGHQSLEMSEPWISET